MDKSIPIYLDGLERSGNVYLANLVRSTFDHDVFSLRTHQLDTLINYKETNPFIVPVRDAFDSISSAKVYRDFVYKNKMYGDYNIQNSDLDTIILRYDHYFDYLIKSPKFFIAPFNYFIENNDQFIDKIIKFYENTLVLKISKRPTHEDMFNDIHNPQLSDNYSREAFSPELGNFPRERSKERDLIEGIILKEHQGDIKRIQGKIDILYQRYEEIKA